MFVVIKDEGVIYSLSFDDKVQYIGKSFGKHRVRERIKEHERFFNRSKHPNKDLQVLYDKYGNFKYSIVESFTLISDEELEEREIYYIDKFDTYLNGANKTIGGNTVTGMTHSDSSKSKIASKMKGSDNHFYNKTHTEESKLKMSEFQKNKVINEKQRSALATQWEKGKPKSDEHKKNISKGLIGRVYSEETKKKISEANKGRKLSDEILMRKFRKLNITETQLLEILIKSNFYKATQSELAEEYNISKNLIYSIKRLKSEYIKLIIKNNTEELFKMTKKLIKFEKNACNPCQMMQNLLDSEGIEVIKYQVFDEPELASEFNVGSVPTLILLDENDQEIKRSVGYKPNEIEEIIENLQ